MKHVNGNWEADWNDGSQIKWCIVVYKGGYRVEDYNTCKRFLAFKSEAIAKQVLRENEDLLEQYKPLATK